VDLVTSKLYRIVCLYNIGRNDEPVTSSTNFTSNQPKNQPQAQVILEDDNDAAVDYYPEDGERNQEQLFEEMYKQEVAMVIDADEDIIVDSDGIKIGSQQAEPRSAIPSSSRSPRPSVEIIEAPASIKTTMLSPKAVALQRTETTSTRMEAAAAAPSQSSACNIISLIDDDNNNNGTTREIQTNTYNHTTKVGMPIPTPVSTPPYIPLNILVELMSEDPCKASDAASRHPSYASALASNDSEGTFIVKGTAVNISKFRVTQETGYEVYLRLEEGSVDFPVTLRSELCAKFLGKSAAECAAYLGQFNKKEMKKAKVDICMKFPDFKGTFIAKVIDLEASSSPTAADSSTMSSTPNTSKQVILLDYYA
jgi:hypothetical protein